MNRMEVKLKRGFFDRCHDYISSYLKDMTSTQSEDDESSSGDDHDDDDEDDVGGGNVVRPSFKMSGPYKKVSTKDRRLNDLKISFYIRPKNKQMLCNVSSMFAIVIRLVRTSVLPFSFCSNV